MPYKLSSDVVDRILDSNNIVDLIEGFLPLKKAGANYNTNCPFHKEKTPSFVVSPQKQIYHCFGCGESGNSLNFLMKYKNYTFVEAAEYLARRANIMLEETNDNEFSNDNKLLLNKLYNINRETATFFYSNLTKNRDALKYLYERNLGSNVIKSFGIGYANSDWDNLLKHLISKGYTEEEILKTGLIIKTEKTNKYYDRFRNRIMFPIFDLKKKIIGFGGRVLDNTLPKYINSPESIIFSKGNNLFGIHIAKEVVKEKGFFLVEGYMDVIKMHSFGLTTAVASLGTSLTENQIKLMKRYSTNFYVVYDSDDAGQKAALKAMNMLKRNNIDGKVVIMPDAKDPDEYLNKFGKQKFDKLIENSLDYYNFLEFHFKESYETSKKVEYINIFFDNIVNVNSEIEKELIFEKLSIKMGVTKESIIKEYNKKFNKKKTFVKNVPAQAIEKKLHINKITTSHEMELIKLIYFDDDFALYLKEIVNEDTFKDLQYYNVFEQIYECKIKNGNVNEDSLKEILKDMADVRSFVQDEDVDYDNLEALFKDCMKRLKIKYYENKKEVLTNSIKQSDNINENKEIMNEIFSLAKKIKSTKEEVS
ncbi:MAG: primase [Bacillota bacterium]|jgi:DNA primase|nr:primase [Bacillota bacterium]